MRLHSVSCGWPVEVVEVHHALDPPVPASAQVNVQCSGDGPQYDRSGAAEDDAPVATRVGEESLDLALQISGLELELVFLPGHRSRRRCSSEDVEHLVQAASGRLAHFADSRLRDTCALCDRAWDGTVEELDAEPLRDARPDDAPSGSVQRCKRYHPADVHLASLARRWMVVAILPDSGAAKREDATMMRVRTAISSRVRSGLASRSPLTAEDVWRLLQATAAATVAWVIAKEVFHHYEPFFAPVAALVSLNTSIGERGLNALRLLEGVIVGIGVAELTLLALGGGYGPFALAIFVALLIARALGGARIVLAQAAVSAILTMAVANGEVGYQRLTDAMIGAGVALVFSQVLFSPEPLRLLRRVESNVLTAMAAALELAARALEGDDQVAESAIEEQRELRDHLSELARMRKASTSVARHSFVWRGQIAPVVRENEDAGYLDLLGGSCLMLTRTALGTKDEDRRLLAPCVHAFSTTLADLAQQPGDRATRQGAVEGSLDALRRMRSIRTRPDPDLTATLTAARIAVTDLMVFAGVDADEARAATREEEREPQLEVPTRTSAGKGRFRQLRRLARLFR
jgi:fusaric acid resistance family protein